jgi:uncharacterized surface protein with fasciclin (FAS1) repeats
MISYILQLVCFLKTSSSSSQLSSDATAVFAPSDAAFAALPAGALEYLLQPENAGILSTVLGYHIVVGDVFSTDLADGMVVSSLTNQMLTISVDAANNGNIAINGATVEVADLIATNGVIHVIDQVLLPPNFVLPPDLGVVTQNLGEVALANGLKTLIAAATVTGQVAVFSQSGELSKKWIA